MLYSALPSIASLCRLLQSLLHHQCGNVLLPLSFRRVTTKFLFID
jgi:hypothetical protein